MKIKEGISNDGDDVRRKCLNNTRSRARVILRRNVNRGKQQHSTAEFRKEVFTKYLSRLITEKSLNQREKNSKLQQQPRGRNITEATVWGNYIDNKKLPTQKTSCQHTWVDANLCPSHLLRHSRLLISFTLTPKASIMVVRISCVVIITP